MATDMSDSVYPDPDESNTVSPSALSDYNSPQPEQPGKKKRKAWGQPIPEFKVVLPPRKRAKTAEEKEQRKNERVIRNRKAADKSRQRQKAAVAELESKKAQMEAELAQLRAKVAFFESKYGTIEGPDMSCLNANLDAFTQQPTSQRDSGAFTKSRLSVSDNDHVLQDPLPADPFAFNKISQLSPGDTSSFTTTPEPTLSYVPDSPRPSMTSNHSPALAPTLFPTHDQFSFTDLGHHDPSPASINFDEASAMTQYPAVSGGNLNDVDFPGTSQAVQHQPPSSPPDGVDDNLRDVLNFNAFAHVAALPDFGRDLVDDLFNGGLDGPSLPTHPFFDYDAYIEYQPADLSNEASESTSRMQSQFGAPSRGSDGQGFAAVS